MSASLAGLAAAPAVRLAREALGESAERAWVVGGAIRDAVLGRQVVDLDLAVEGDPGAIARAIADAASGPAFELSAEFGNWRALDRDRRWHVDVSALRAPTIEGDLELRDFTANALALPLGSAGSGLLDPFGGLADIEARTLRQVGEGSFADDPLRILRGVRLAAELGFEIEAETTAAAARLADRAGEPAGERQLAELRLLVGGPDPLRGLDLLDRLDATAAVLPELAALHGVGQNLNHHLDVHDHTVEVLANLLAIERDLGRYAGESAGEVERLLAEPLADEMTRGTALRFGALLHDSAKPITREEHGEGRVSFVGHDREGVAVVRGAFARLKASRALSRHVEALTLHHLHLGFLTHERPLSRRRVYEYLKLCEPVAADVTLLTIADRLGARGSGPFATDEMVEAHLELAQEVLPAALAWHRDGPPRVPISGDALAAALGIAPGPRLGELLGEVEAGVFAGEVRSAEDAIRVARGAGAETE